jgi:hypothetical protein
VESIPRSTDKDVSVELVLPKTYVILGNGGDQGGGRRNQFIFKSLDDTISHILARDDVVDSAFYSSGSAKIFYVADSSHVVWVQWLRPGEGLSTVLKYQIKWPDEKQIDIY